MLCKQNSGLPQRLALTYAGSLTGERLVRVWVETLHTPLTVHPGRVVLAAITDASTHTPRGIVDVGIKVTLWWVAIAVASCREKARWTNWPIIVEKVFFFIKPQSIRSWTMRVFGKQFFNYTLEIFRNGMVCLKECNRNGADKISCQIPSLFKI